MQPISEPRAQRRFAIMSGVTPALLFLASRNSDSRNTAPSAKSMSTESTLKPVSETPTTGWIWVSEPSIGFSASVPAHWKREITQETDALKRPLSYRLTNLSYRPSSVTDKSQAVSIDVDAVHNPTLALGSGTPFFELTMQMDKVGPFVTTVKELRKQERKVLVPLQATRLGSYPAAWSVADYTPTGSKDRVRVLTLYAATNSAFYTVGVAGFAEYGEEADMVFDHLRNTIQLTESTGTLCANKA